MTRRLLNLLTALSLLLCVAAAVLWARSYIRMDVLQYRSMPVARIVNSNRGTLTLVSKRFLDAGPAAGEWRHLSGPAAPGVAGGSRRWSVLGFSSSDEAGMEGVGPRLYQYAIHVYTIPYWSLVLIALALPAWWAVGYRRRVIRRRRRELHRCEVCGYDLHATPDRCPECGTAATVHTTA